MQANFYAATHRLEAEEDRWIDAFLSTAIADADDDATLDEAIAEVAERAGTLLIQAFPNFFGWVGDELTLPQYVTELIRTEMKARLTDSVRTTDEPIRMPDIDA